MLFTRKSSLARGASVMVISVMAAKILGLVYVIPLTQLIHGTGLGYYSSAYALYGLLLTLSTSGFPTAMGKVISERWALEQYGDIEQLFWLTLRIVVVFGVVAFVVMWFGAPLYSRLVEFNAPQTEIAAITLSVRAVAPSLLIIPAMSALRGYLQGFQRMEPSGYSQAIEQLFRVIFIVIGAYLVVKVFSPGNIAGGAAAATFGSFVGGGAALWLLISAVRHLRRDLGDKRIVKSAQSGRTALKLLWKYALPVSLGTLVLPISQQVDVMTVPNLLLAVHHNAKLAMGDYGIYARQALQLVNIPLAFAFAIGSSVLPAIASAHARRDDNAISRQVRGTIRSMFFVMFPTAIVLLLLAQPVDYALFYSPTNSAASISVGTRAIASVSVMSVFSGLELISTYVLQGLDKMYRPVRNMFIGVAVKLVFNLVLIPHFGIVGAAIGSTIGFLCSSTLNILAVRKYATLRFSIWREILPALLSTLVTGICMEVLYRVLKLMTPPAHPVVWAWVQLVVILSISAIIYVYIAMRWRAVTSAEVQSIPAVGRRLSHLARRIQPEQG